MTFRIATLALTLVGSAAADTLTLRNGTNVTGSWVGVDAQQISFKVNDQVQTYPRTDVSRVTFAAEPERIQMKPIEPPPPPPPAPTETKTISIGDTKEKVVTVFGQPERMFKSGAKEVYFFKDAKVTFVNGKVADIE